MSSRRFGIRRATGHRCAAVLVGVAVGFAAFAPAAPAREPVLRIELNKLETAGQGCRAYFLFENRMGITLDRFRLDLVLFDDDGVVSRRFLLDMAPLRNDKETLAAFLLDDVPCSRIGRILVNDIPACRAETGATADCLGALDLRTRTGTDLVQ